MILILAVVAVPSLAFGQGAPVIADCQAPSSPQAPFPLPVSVTVDPSTAWQPRSGQVLVSVNTSADLPHALMVRACFGWGTDTQGDYYAADNLKKIYTSPAYVIVEPSKTPGVANFSVGVPPGLPEAPEGMFDRIRNGMRFSGLGAVPIADMRLIGYTDTGIVFDVVRPVGITRPWVAAAIALGASLTAMLVIYGIAVPPRGPSIRDRFGPLLGLRWVLLLVCDATGRASLSRFQVLLWTVLIATGSVYVMALSGQLINVTPGALVLLGIAGGASLLTNVAQPIAPAEVGSVPVPMWAHLVQDTGGGRPEVTRLQMLLFTVVTAGFVALKILNTYTIPDVPDGYLVLMGISNGVYVGQKFTK